MSSFSTVRRLLVGTALTTAAIVGVTAAPALALHATDPIDGETVTLATTSYDAGSWGDGFGFTVEDVNFGENGLPNHIFVYEIGTMDLATGAYGHVEGMPAHTVLRQDNSTFSVPPYTPEVMNHVLPEGQTWALIYGYFPSFSPYGAYYSAVPFDVVGDLASPTDPPTESPSIPAAADHSDAVDEVPVPAEPESAVKPQLAETGTDPVAPVVLGGMTLVLGVIVLTARRRVRSSR
ncbi:hypothetical protein QCD70_00725 [Agreia sp. PsM10]|uniref:hypothetical protein n=1 Tax=Agreia sp. PsM10 TaxID=3030533 RepID=UPI00263AEB8A|nr:hypothetical protein [Agreia sp. PsM10]MDN4638756.1 hypothetical protein [Agreia sp. PsM10]